MLSMARQLKSEALRKFRLYDLARDPEGTAIQINNVKISTCSPWRDRREYDAKCHDRSPCRESPIDTVMYLCENAAEALSRPVDAHRPNPNAQPRPSAPFWGGSLLQQCTSQNESYNCTREIRPLRIPIAKTSKNAGAPSRFRKLTLTPSWLTQLENS
jgi:hypothetical protein